MALRSVKTRVPEERRDEVVGLTDDLEIVEFWVTRPGDQTVEVEFFVDAEETEALVDAVESRFGTEEHFRIVIAQVEAAVPRPEEPEEEDEEETDGGEGGGEDEAPDDEGTPPISIDELYDDVTSGLGINWTYTTLVVLSSIVAAIGLIRDDVAMVIAAMIIAPLLRPNIALSLATTLADGQLAWRAGIVNVFGLALSVAVALAFGAFVPFDAAVDQIALRTRFGLLEFLLAGSAGTAGALSFVTGEADRVVGVMVAVALLPPAVVAGMLVGSGAYGEAAGAGLLTVANLVCLNLAGVVTFFIQNVRPRSAWETERARRAIRVAVVIWLGLLAILAALILLGGGFRRYP